MHRYALTVLLLAGCGQATTQTTTGPDPARVHADLEGNVPVPEEFPADAPRYPGARVAASAAVGDTVQITLETADAKPKLIEFYAAELPRQGWAIELQRDSNGVASLYARKGSQPLTVEIEEDAGRAHATLKYKPARPE